MASLIPDQWGVPEKFRQRLGSSAGSQRPMADAGFENQGPVTFWLVSAVAFATGFLVRSSVTRGDRKSD